MKNSIVESRKVLWVASIVLTLPLHVFAWDVEHDLVAQLAAESLPAEVRATFSGDDALAIVRYSHIPDQDESREPPRFRTLEELATFVGSADVAEMQSAGAASARFFHDDAGIVTLFHLLAKAFHAGDTAKAAFYFGTLTHTLADRSSLNHTPLLHWTYSGLVPRVESPERGRFGRPITFSPQGPVTARARALLARRTPQLLADDVPEAAICALEAQAALSSRAAELEATIAWGDEKPAQEALAQLVAEQVGAMVDAGWTAWKLRDKACSVAAMTLAAAASRFEKAVRACDPAKEAVYRGVFDETLNPAAPKATVGIVCENYRGVVSTLSFGGKAIVGAAARTLRDAGYAVKGLNLWTIESLPDPKEMAMVIVALKNLKPGERSTIPGGFLRAIAQYRAAGGRILVIGGEDPGGITDFRPSLKPLPDAAIPVAAAWGETNGELWRRRGVVCATSLARTAGVSHPFMRNPSVGAYTKGVCRFEVTVGDGLSQLAWVYDNAPGGGRRVVAARSVRVAWVPEYLFVPFVLSSGTAVNWGDLRLDSFGSAFLLDVVEDLLSDDKPVASEKAVVLPEKYARDPGAAFALVFVTDLDVPTAAVRAFADDYQDAVLVCAKGADRDRLLTEVCGRYRVFRFPRGRIDLTSADLARPDAKASLANYIRWGSYQTETPRLTRYGARVYRAKRVAGDPPALDLPTPWRLVEGDDGATGCDSRLYYFTIEADGAPLPPPTVTIRWPGVGISSVDGATNVVRLADGLSLVPTASSGGANYLTMVRDGAIELALHHHVEGAQHGPYGGKALPWTKIRASDNWRAALHAVFKTAGFASRSATEGADVKLYGFDSNFPRRHVDHPEHFHVMLEWDGWKKNNVGHYTLDADGFIRGNNFLVCGGITGGLKDGYHPQCPGETTEYIGPSGKPLFSIEMLPGGKGLVMRRPGSSIEWRVRSEAPAEDVAIAYRRDPATRWQELGSVSVTDDTEAGEMDYVFRRTAGEILDRESIHYVRDTGRLLRAPGFDFAKVTAFHVSWD